MNSYFAKELSDSGDIVRVHCFSAKEFPESNANFVEITEDEYNAIKAEWLANIPEPDPDEISDSEALGIILGGKVE